ncbi:MAG: SusC/RagA family TonB-linked outer membrane protein [Chitinophagaceae bacterium]
MKKMLLIVLGVLTILGNLYAQNRTITGTVTDAAGKPLPNVSVQIKGSTSGTVTNEAGIFSLSVPATARTVTVSSVGFASTDIAIGSRTAFDVELKTEDQALSEVVVVAYGTQRKEALTGSVGQVSAEDIKNRPIANITNALEGTIAGVVTSTASGQPGAGLGIRVRGFGSINATSDPLYVVDGVPYVGNTANINPADVESITVLKDAASTALYGSRAANGVVVITTKRGRKGRNAISVRMLQGVASRGLKEYERVDAFQYYPLLWEAYRNSLIYPVSGTGISMDSANRVASGLTTRTGIKGQLSYNPFNVPDNMIVGVNGQLNPAARLLYPDDLDWTRDILKNANRKDYTVNLNGGAEKSDYFLSVGYLDEGGYTLNTDYERFTARLNVNVQPRTWIRTGLNLSGNYSTSNTARDGGSTNFVNPFFFSRNIGPIYPVFAHNMTTGDYLLDAKGQRFWDLGNMGGTQGVPNRPGSGFAGRHALGETTLNEQLFNRTVVSARNFTEFTFLRNFKFTNNVAVDFQNQGNSSFDNPIVGDGAPAGRSRRQFGTSTGLIASQLLNYGKTFSSHRIDLLGGHETFNQLETDVNGFKQGQSLTGNTELGNFTTINSLTSSVDRYRIESYFSRVNYDFEGKYFASASIRTDGNSRFAAQSRWGTFWSVGGGWNLNKEKFMDNIEWVDLLKLRGSYGVVGVADGIGFYAYQGLYNYQNNANQPGIIQSQTAFFNPDLTWEENRQSDLGLDFSLFKGRINGSLEYYNRVSADLLFEVPQPLSSGVLTFTQNTATMFNRGLEAQINADVIRTKNFIWNSNINLSTVTNEITKMPESIPEFITGTKKYSVGSSIFDYWLRTYYGVDPSDGAALYKAENTASATGRRIIDNKNGGKDTVTTLASNGKFEYTGTAIPDLYGSFTQAFTFRDFTLSALFTFQVGGKTYDANYQGLMSSGSYGGALHTDVLNRWQKPGDVTDVPRLDAGRLTDFNAASSRWLIDASYINIRTLSLAYSLPKTLLSRLSITSSQFFISAENVAFYSKRQGLNNQQAFSGVTSNGYPPARVITAGLTLNL